MRILAILAGLWLVALPLAAQQPTFSTRRESVRVDVLVTDGGRPVRGLTAADFEVLDSGVPQQVDFVSFEDLPVGVVLALDASASISPAQMDHLRQGGGAVLNGLRAQDQAALLTFADAVVLRERLTDDVARVRTAVSEITATTEASGGTALIDACYTAMTLADADAGRALLIAFTDGVDTSSWLDADRVLQAARRSNAVVYGVSTSDMSGSFLDQLSGVTGGQAIKVASTADLSATFLRIIQEFRQRYLISFSPAGVSNDSWHPLTVRVKGRRVDVKTRAGYFR